MKYVQVPVIGGEIQIDTRGHTVDLVLAIEDGSRTMRVSLVGIMADHVVEKVVHSLASVRQDVLEELTCWAST